nr:uncharacterized protein CI109_007369 [Kwoniella shandongensis]KAA5524298.1 hypothetical protein CI109_007369 [Kwoniella shandongensis]
MSESPSGPTFEDFLAGAPPEPTLESLLEEGLVGVLRADIAYMPTKLDWKEKDLEGQREQSNPRVAKWLETHFCIPQASRTTEGHGTAQKDLQWFNETCCAYFDMPDFL